MTTSSTPKLHLKDGAVVEFRPRGRLTFWRRGTIRKLPADRWAIEMMGPGTREPMDGRFEYRSINGAPLHILNGCPWWAREQAVA